MAPCSGQLEGRKPEVNWQGVNEGQPEVSST